MSKNMSDAMAVKSARKLSTRTVVYCALLAALQVVLARLIVPMPAVDTRFSIEAVPVVLAGVLFGPLPGALVGFAADLVGTLFSGYGYNPLFALPPILYGVCGGLFRGFLAKKVTLWRVFLVFLPPIVLGSWLWQSAALAYVYNSAGAFLASFGLQLTKRGIQFAITIVLDVLVTHLLFKSRIFNRAGVWPPKPREERKAGPEIV